MKYKVIKSDVPVVWLDTHAITTIAYEVHKKEAGKQYDANVIDAFHELAKLRIEHKVICFESDQLLELGVRPELVKISTRVMSQLSGGLRVHDWRIKNQQVEIGIDACAKNLSSATISWRDIYENDPLEDKSFLGMVVRCDVAVPFRVSQKRAMDKITVNRWREIKEDLAKKYTSHKDRFNYQLGKERNGDWNLVKDILDYEKNDPSNVWLNFKPQLLDCHTGHWLAINPDCKDANAAVLNFFQSEYNTELPVNDISCTLYAERLASNEDLKDSDKTDIDNIASFLPYVNYMLIDKAMIDKVEKHGLDKKYQVKLFRLKDISDIIAEIRAK